MQNLIFILLASCVIGLPIIGLGFFMARQRSLIRIPGFHVILPCLLLMFTGVGYGLWGGWPVLKGLAHHQARLKQQDQLRPLHAKVNKKIALLECESVDRPEDPSVWWELGQLYQIQQSYFQAADALQRAYALQPDNVALLAEYVTVRIQSQEGRLDEMSRDLLNVLLSHDPEHPIALNGLAMDAFQRKEYERSTALWTQILQSMKQKNASHSAIARLEEMLALSAKKQEDTP